MLGLEVDFLDPKGLTIVQMEGLVKEYNEREPLRALKTYEPRCFYEDLRRRGSHHCGERHEREFGGVV